jgi:hypothetical protein
VAGVRIERVVIYHLLYMFDRLVQAATVKMPAFIALFEFGEMPHCAVETFALVT